jgi:hypothetical protein
MYSLFSRKTAADWTGAEHPLVQERVVISGAMGAIVSETRAARLAYFNSFCPGEKKLRAFADASMKLFDQIDGLQRVNAIIVTTVTGITKNWRDGYIEMHYGSGKEDMQAIALETVCNALEFTREDIEVVITGSTHTEQQRGLLCEVRDQGKGPNTQQWVADAELVKRKAKRLDPESLEAWIAKKFRTPLIPRLSRWIHSGKDLPGHHSGNGKARILNSRIVRTTHDTTSGGCNTISMIGPFELANKAKGLANRDRGSYAVCYEELPEFQA